MTHFNLLVSKACVKIAKPILFFVLFLVAFFQLDAQNNSQLSLSKVASQKQASPTTDLVVFKASENKRLEDAELIFKEVFNPSVKTTFQFLSEDQDRKGSIHKKWQQYFNAIKVEFAVVALHGKNNIAEFLTSEYYSIPDSFNTSPSITAESAFQKALDQIGAQNYMWEYPEAALEMDNYTKPAGELVLLPVYGSNEHKSQMDLKLAYKFDMFATNPISRGDLYIDAQTKEVLFYNAIIKHTATFGFVGERPISVPTEEEYCKSTEDLKDNVYLPLVLGTAATRYSGTQNIETSVAGPDFSLNDTTRGGGVFTRDALNQAPGSTYPYVSNYSEFLDNNNNWTAGEWDNTAKDNAALDAHWGAMMTYDYWLNTHGRNSYNGGGASIRSYVHVDVNYNNAFWNGSVMSYGDGSCGYAEGCNGFDALTSIDVAAHEIGHAVTTYTSNLAYQRESGAMNEGFSDIWGAAVEYYAKGTGPENNPNDEVWLIGDEIDRRSGSIGLRSMSNPNARSQPDTYGGSFWINPNCGTPTNGNDYCGVHTNSGVLNYWFYLLVEGGSGTNDIGSNFNVGSIGMTDASTIAYATLQLLSSNSTYANARTLSIQATTTEFGACSPEVESVTNAWYAVGVGAAFVNTCIPEISFATTAENRLEGSECGFTDIDVTLNIAIAATADADVNFTVNGSSTATSGLDFNLLSPSVTFPSGTTTPKTMTIRVYEDSFVESDETVIIDFTVNPNGGDAVADTNADTYTLTITNDDAAPMVTSNVTIYLEDFDDGSYDVTTAGNTGSDLWQAGNTAAATSAYWNTTGNTTVFAFTNDDNCNCDKSNDRLTTTVIDLSGGYSSATLTFDHAFADVSETGTVRFSTNGTSYTTVSTLSNSSTSNGGGSYTTPWVNNNSINIPAPYLGSSTFYIQFLYNDGGTWAYGMAVDNIEVTAVTNTGIQTAVNIGSPDQLDIAAAGTVHSSDPTSGNVMVDISNNNSFDYGCTNVSVSRSGSSGQSYNGSLAPDLVTDKTFDISPSNTTSSGDTTLTFYFEENEIAGWEAATGLDRNIDLLIGRGNTSSITETSIVTIGAFGGNVTVTGNFSGLDGTYYFGTSGAFVSCVGGLKTWNGSNWSPSGIPDITNSVIIQDDYNTSINGGSISACNIFVDPGKTLTIAAGHYLNVEGNITVDGNLVVEHTGSVVQTDDTALVTNNGGIAVNLTTPTLNPRDFMIMGSPMTEEDDTMNTAYQVLNHTTANFTPYVGVPPVVGVNFHDQEFDDWSNYTGILTPGEGYLVRPSYTSGGTYNYVYDQGTLNNGVITYPAYFGVDQEDSPNVLSNPYASAIDANLFISTNSSIVDVVYFWEHLTTPNGTIPGPLGENFSMEDISMYNGTMGVPAANGGGTPNHVISTGQGFGIKALSAGDVTFNNSMRLTSGNTTLRRPIEKDLIWLTVRDSQYHMGSTTGIGFMETATSGYDEGYDSMKLGTVVSLYSHLEDGSELLGIQGIEPFDTSKKIPMGFSTMIDPDSAIPYTISISAIEGSNIELATVYLVDHQENTITNLSEGDYTFLSDAATYNNRFTLQFESEVILGTSENDLEQILIYPNPTQDVLTIVSPQVEVTSAIVYDLRGRVVAEKLFTTQGTYQIDLSKLETAMYFVKISTKQDPITKCVIKL